MKIIKDNSNLCTGGDIQVATSFLNNPDNQLNVIKSLMNEETK